MYSTLRRPKRKLCYISDKKCPSKKWADKMSLGDIDKIFDDLEASSPDEDDELAAAPLLHISGTTSCTEEAASPARRQQGPRIKEPPKGSPQQCVSPKPRPLSPELDIGLNCPFSAHRPVKTSSPIEKKSVANCMEEVHNKEGVLSPIIFLGEDGANVDNGRNESDFESPPQRVTLNKCKITHDKRTPLIPGQKRPGSPASAARRETEAKMQNGKKPEPVRGRPCVETCGRAEKDVTTFLQKLRDAAQPKPPRSRKSLTPVKITSPELDDDFLILEDDEVFRICIPSTAATSKRHRRPSSRDKEGSTDKGAKGSSALKQPHADQPNDKLQPQTVGAKGKKKGRDAIASSEKNEVALRGNDVDVPESAPACDFMEPQKPSKRKQPGEGPSKASDKAEEQPQTGRRASGGRAKPAEKKEDRREKSNHMKTVTDDSEAKVHKSSKGTRKAPQDLVCDDATVAEDNRNTLPAKPKKKHQRGKLPAASEQSSPRDGLIIPKRKRRQPGEWWVSSCQRPEDTDVTVSQPTPKKAKQNKKESKMSPVSPANAKKDGAPKKGTRKQPAQSSLPKTKTQPFKKGNKEKREKQNNNLNLKGCAPGRRKLFDEVEAEQFEQQEVADQVSGPLHSSPLILPERDHSLNPNSQVFQKVYQQGNSGKKHRPAAASPKKSTEQPGPEEREKRRRQPTGNWWVVKGSPDDVESSSSQPERQEVKRRTERKRKPKRTKSPGLKTPQNNSLTISPIPPGGAPTPPLRAKTITRSLATFKEIFTSATETPAVSMAALNNGRVVATKPAVVPECSAGEDNTANVISMDAGDLRYPNSQEPPESSTNQSDMLKSLRSGPTCTIELQQYEENDEMNLPSSRFEAVLSASDLCGPPLKPLTLQPKDKANLSLWFKSLWSVTADRGPDITPDDFDWYFYKGRAVGIQEDLTCSSICNGKLLLGSFMKKPLWVDHSANTVFSLLTSSVKVSINGRESRFFPAQSFMVQSGEAYSVQNLTGQPAVLYFTRIFAESLD